MALKDLVSDLSAFKGQTTPDSIDNQIEKGVDFFDNETAGATGFTPKTNLETEYNKFMKSTNSLPNEYNGESTISSPNSGVRTNTKTRSAFGQNGEYSEEGNPGLSNPSHILDSDTSLAPVNQPQFTSAFMTTPIADYLSSYDPTQPFSNDLTLTRAVEQHTSTGPTQYTISAFDDTPLYENAHGTSLLPVLNQFDFTIFRERNRSSETPPFHSSVTAPFTNVPLPSPFLENRYVVEFGSAGVMNLRDRYKDGSIHIEAGDSQSPIGGEVVEFASLMPLVNRTSQFSTPEDIAGDNVYTVPATYPTATPQTTLNLQRENFRTTEDVTTDTFQSEFSATTMKENYEDSVYIDNLFEFRDGTYKNVPSGMTENNKFGTKTFREVADPNNFDLFRQPFILREVGNNWGLNPISSDTGFFGALAAGADDILGGFFRGAPSFTGLVERNFADKIRIGKFLLTTDGIGFLGKQFVLQGLNPTLETKRYNPLSILGIPIGAIDDPEGVIQSGGAQGLATLLASLALPINHAERHIGGGRYGDIVPLGENLPEFITNLLPSGMDTVFNAVGKFNNPNTGYGSRIAMQSNPEVIKKQSVNFGFGVTAEIGGRDLVTSMLLMNPNKYLFPISSAPKSIDKGIPSFTGTVDLLRSDARKIEDKIGGTFNNGTNVGDASNDSGNKTIFHTSPYDKLTKLGEGDERLDYEFNGKMPLQSMARKILNQTHNVTKDEIPYNRKVADTGNQGGARGSIARPLDKDGIGDSTGRADLIQTAIRIGTDSKIANHFTDKVNMLPYGTKDEVLNNQKINDFIKFKFHDMVNNKFIIFRAILEGISDSITPEYGEERYVGRPDKVYIYQGADRNISFGFKIYPKTAQELPILMEKLNYLVGMCYPSYTPEERMITPLISLTMGDMFDRVTGLLGSLTVTVEDASTWEINDGLQFPHFISAQCEFKYIGNNVLASKGKHYGINWIPDGNSNPATRFTDKSQLGFSDYPNRKSSGDKDFTPLYGELGQPAAERTT